MGGGGAGVRSVRILGSVEGVSGDGAPVAVPSTSQRRLVAVLALHAPRSLRAEWLADVLDVSPGALRTLVSRLRAVVGTAVIETTSTGYRLRAEVDAQLCCRAFAEAPGAPDPVEVLGRALAGWTGPPLEEFRGEPWASGEIARLTEIHAAASDDLGAALLARGRCAEAVAGLERQVADHPYRDRSRGLLMRSLAGSGRQAEALRAFHDYRTFLAEEVGTDPSAELVDIERRIATGWNGRERDVDTDRTAAFEVPLDGVLAREGTFVARGRELEVLEVERQRSVEHGLRAVIVSGEPGIGKTSLLARFARQLADRHLASVAYGRCEEAIVPLQPFRTIIGTYVASAPVGVLEAHVAACGGELLRIAPQLGYRVDPPPPTDTDHATERYLLFEAVADLLRRLSEWQPLVVLLDDLQWAEPTALQLLVHLADALVGAPLLAVVSFRDTGESDTEGLRLALADVQQVGAVRLELVGLDEAELAELVSEERRSLLEGGAPAADPTDLAARLVRETAGHPLYATQLLRHWDESGEPAPANRGGIPRTLRDVVWRRVDALGADATDVLTAAAVLGHEFEESVLVEIVDLSEPVVAASLDDAVRSGLLAELDTPGRSVRFVHPLVADALYTDLGAARRTRLHARSAEALTGRQAALGGAGMVSLARHCALGGLPGEARHWYTVAGDAAIDDLAPMEAIQHYRAALDLVERTGRPDSERADLLVRLGEAQERAGDPDAFATLEAGAALAQRCRLPGVLARAALATDRGTARVEAGATEQRAMIEAAFLMADRTNPATCAELGALLAQSLTYAGETDRRIMLAREALGIAETIDDPALFVRVAVAAANALTGPTHSLERAELARRAIDAAEVSGDPMLLFRAHYLSHHMAVVRADRRTVDHSVARLRATAARYGTPRMGWMMGVLDAFHATMQSHLGEAEALATSTLEVGMAISEPDAFAVFATQYFAIATFEGRHLELAPLMEQAMDDRPGIFTARLAYAIVCSADGRVDEARTTLEEALATGLAMIPNDNLRTTNLVACAILAIELEHLDAARVLLPLLEPLSPEVSFNGAGSQGPIAAYSGKLASLLGQHDLADERLHEALRITELFGWTYHRATTRYAMAEARFRRLGRLDAEAREWLDDATALCAAGGYAVWLAKAVALEAAAARGPTPEATPDALSGGTGEDVS
jgi:DNA-binding SARP family transcriptional activator/tetratricopeptide (TPR) repeat protein